MNDAINATPARARQVLEGVRREKIVELPHQLAGLMLQPLQLLIATFTRSTAAVANRLYRMPQNPARPTGCPNQRFHSCLRQEHAMHTK